METFNQSINNEHVNLPPETLDGSGISEPADSNPKIFYQSESSTSSEGTIDITFGCEREDPEVLESDNHNYPLIHNNGINNILIPAETSGFGCEREDPDVLESGNNSYPLTHIDGTNSILVPSETSSSSSSSESSSNDFFQSRKVRFAESAESKFISEDEQSDVSRESSVKSEAGQNSPTSTSQIYNTTYDHIHMAMSPTVVPPVQIMDRSTGNDGQRIPSSVFASKRNSMDWSYASNDSLFSIQLGNASLARDTSLARDNGFLSHEELTNSGELNMFHPPPSDLIEDTDAGRKSVQMEDSQTTEMLDEDLKLEERPSKENSHPADSYESTNVAGPSHCNGTSSHSSALTIKKKCTWPLCYCNTCSWFFRYTKLPCSYFSCSICCLICPSCCLTEEKRPSYAKTDRPQPQSSNNSSEETSSSTSNCCNWLQCFSWCCCCFTCCSQTESPRQKSSSNILSEVTSSSTSKCCNWCQCFSWCCCCFTGCSHKESPQQQQSSNVSEVTSSSTSNCCNWCQCFSWSCCTGSSHTESPQKQSSNVSSEATSSSTSKFCNWCQCFSWSCCTGSSHTESPQQKSSHVSSEVTSSSTSNWCQCFSWFCCTGCSHTESPEQQSSNVSSEVTSSSTSNCCNWCQCFSWSCFTGSHTENPQQQSFDKASKQNSSSTSNCYNCWWRKWWC